MIGQQEFSDWDKKFKKQSSIGFNPKEDLKKIAVINQTTMLAEETEEISNLLNNVISGNYSGDNSDFEFANTRDTLCYATNDNQKANKELVSCDIDLVLIVGGFNSSNTTHLAEIHSKKHLTLFIDSADKIESNFIRHYSLITKQLEEHKINWERVQSIAIVGGASCPDSIIQNLIVKVLSFKPQNADIDAAVNQLEQNYNGL